MLKVIVRTLAAVALACVSCLLLVCGSAGATPTWLVPTNLSAAGDNAIAPRVAVDQQGDALAVWESSNGSHYVVQASARSIAAGAWEPPVDLSAAGANTQYATVGSDARGDVVAVWQSYDGTEYTVWAAVRPMATGAWQAPVLLSALGVPTMTPQVAVDPHGDAMVVWTYYDDIDHHFLVQADRRLAGGSWEAPVQLSAFGQGAANPQVAFDAQGDAVAVWDRYDGSHSIVQAARLRAGSSVWELPAVNLSAAGGDAREEQVALDSQGDAIAVWTRTDASGNSIIQTSERPASIGSWKLPATNLSATDQSAFYPAVAISPQGNAVAVWSGDVGGDAIVQASSRPSGDGVWQPPQDLPAAGDQAYSPQVGIDSDGNAVAVWQNSSGGVGSIDSAARPAGSGTWQGALGISAAGGSSQAQFAFDSHGNGVAVWTLDNGTNAFTQAAGLDAAGPLLSDLAIPPTGVVGRPVRLSVSPLDVWSPLAATSWRFGDGQTATGAAVGHTYTEPGSYTVSVSSADTLNNTSTTTASIEIAPAPPTTKPPAPTLTRVSETSKRWREGNREAVLTRTTDGRAPVGTNFSFTLNEAARITFVFRQTEVGRRVGRKCQAPTSHTRRRPRCRRTLTRGTLAYTANAGRRRLAFQGHLAIRRLPLGAYTLTLTATNARGQHSRPHTLRFTIVR